MQPISRISTHWNEPHAIAPYGTGVSLHSHTSLSEETLQFIHVLGMALPGGMALTRHYEKLCRERYGLTLDFKRANWRPPLQPRMAYEVESQQILGLGLYPLVSITDHDTIEAALLLRTMPSSRHIPMSVEWSAPFGQTVFHLGIHNLPSADGVEWMRRFEAFTAHPEDARLLAMLRELHAQRQVLIVFNHPLWDLHSVGPVHGAEVRRFLAEAEMCVHAVELNGLRHAKENRETARLARETGHLPIAGGDRHGLEPNANINLTSATSFTEFVEEIRVERRSHVHFMDQYRERWEQRILRSTLNAITDFPQFVPGWQRWDERAFHPDAQGVMRPLSELWPGGKPPIALMAAIRLVRLGGKRGLSAPLSLAFPGVNLPFRQTHFAPF
jgi:predicted metal-dependent phosphoesterase TrpH